jgi:hypothetical protein
MLRNGLIFVPHGRASHLPVAVERLEPRRMLASDPIVSITAKADAFEGAGDGRFTVRRGGSEVDLSAPLTVNVRLSPGASTASGAADLAPVVKSVRIRPGMGHAHFSLTPVDDPAPEGNETIVMKVIAGPSYAVDNIRPAARIRLVDDEPTTSIHAIDSTASESDPAGAGSGQFMMVRTGDTSEPLVVGYYIRPTSTATRGRDFETLGGTVTIPAGATSVSFSLVPIDDDDVEDSETVQITIRADPAYLRTKKHSAQVVIADNDQPRVGWLNRAWHYRAPISASVGAHARTDQPVERDLNFTALLDDLDRAGALIEDSLRVVETSADGRSILNDDVPFQFDRADDYDAATNATGRLVFLLTGQTPANATRHFHVYFDTTGTFSPAQVTPRVSITDDVEDEGQSSFRITTPSATYFYHKQGGGFSSIIDSAGNDWISYNPQDNPGSAGVFRGMPNAGTAFHPGYTNSTSRIVSHGPLKVTIESASSDGSRAIRWDIYPTHARATVLRYSGTYWFLYEGTPGGALDGNDYVVRSDGTRTNIDTRWTEPAGLGAGNGEEWVYFGDSAASRYLFLVHDDPDSIEDSYYDLDDNMTVFGFGRRSPIGEPAHRLMTAQDNRFTIGFGTGEGEFTESRISINGAYRTILTNIGPAQPRS